MSRLYSSLFWFVAPPIFIRLLFPVHGSRSIIVAQIHTEVFELGTTSVQLKLLRKGDATPWYPAFKSRFFSAPHPPRRHPARSIMVSDVMCICLSLKGINFCTECFKISTKSSFGLVVCCKVLCLDRVSETSSHGKYSRESRRLFGMIGGFGGVRKNSTLKMTRLWSSVLVGGALHVSIGSLKYPASSSRWFILMLKDELPA